MQPRVATAGPFVAGSLTAIATAQAVAGVGNLPLNGSTVSGGVATLDGPRQVVLTSSGNDSARTITVTGTDASGSVISETLAGGNPTAVTVLGYATVTQISINGATAGTIEAGTNGVGYSSWIMLDPWAMGTVSGQVSVSGTVNFTVQCSNDDPNSYGNPVAPALMAWDSTIVNVGTGESIFSLSAAPLWVRILLNSGSGSVRLTLVQHSSVPY